MTGFGWNILFLLMIFLGPGCNHQVPDFQKIDRSISEGHLKQAKSVLLKASRYSYADSMVQKKIAYRLFKVDKYYFFSKVDSLIQQSKWRQSAHVLDSLTKVVNTFPQKKKRKYRFDLFYKKYLTDSAMVDTAAAFTSLKKAVVNWTDNRDLLQKAFSRLCFCYAERGQFIKAREMMDKALRLYDVNKLSPALRLVFFDYMEGRFNKARRLLEQTAAEEKSGCWLQLEKFLQKYEHALTLKDRFKLW